MRYERDVQKRLKLTQKAIDTVTSFDVPDEYWAQLYGALHALQWVAGEAAWPHWLSLAWSQRERKEAEKRRT